MDKIMTSGYESKEYMTQQNHRHWHVAQINKQKLDISSDADQWRVMSQKDSHIHLTI
jgi:hypothetical protein